MKSKRIIIFSGAGISQPSGISTFRDKNGLWENHKITDICNYKTWEENYNKVHEFYNQRRVQLATVEPNIAHKTIAKWQEQFGSDRVINITQNVDDLFERAGVEGTLHIHGDLDIIKCHACGAKWSMNYKEFDYKKGHCPTCYNPQVKPSVIFFGEHPPLYDKTEDLLANISTEDILIIIGTMGNVYPIEYFMYNIVKNFKQNPTMILNNMDFSKDISEDYFTKEHIFYESCITAIEKIDKIIQTKMER